MTESSEVVEEATSLSVRKDLETDGFGILRDYLCRADVECLRHHVHSVCSQLERYGDAAYDNVRFKQVVNTWQEDEAFRDYLIRGPLSRLLKQLIPRPVVIFTQAMKRHAYSTGGAFHVDSMASPFGDPEGLTVWIPLDDATVENGCVWHLPGSHKSCRWQHPPEPTKPMIDGLMENFPEWRSIDPVPAVCNRGDVVVHSAHVAHLGGPNMSRLDRYVLILHCVDASAVYLGRPDRHQTATRALSPGDTVDDAIGYLRL